MMLALLLYAYCKGQRSSRVIERECVEDVAYRVIAANPRPDHTTIARFRQRHETALADLFSGVLSCVQRPDLVEVGVIAIDGTKVRANASQRRERVTTSRSPKRFSRRPPRPTGSRTSGTGRSAAMSCRRSCRPSEGRRGWLREAKRRLDEKRAAGGRADPAFAPSAPFPEARRRLEEDLAVECRGELCL